MAADVLRKITLRFRGFLILIPATLSAIQIPPAHAGAFTSEEFLSWAPRNQAFYIEASVGMASLIAGQRDTAQGRCIDDWYYGDEAAGTASILGVMRENPRNHPRGIVLAVLQKRCGPIGQ